MSALSVLSVLTASILTQAQVAVAVAIAAGAGTKVVLSNDDGWATANIRALYAALSEEGYNVVLSAPAENRSGTGSLDVPPLLPVITGCEFDSCPPRSPATGYNESDPRLNYVNSFPATSARLGITDFGPPFFDGAYPDIVVAGPNVGGNTGLVNQFSGTLGAATTAAHNFGIPAIAVSGAFDMQVGYTILSSDSEAKTAATVYAQLTADLLSALLSPGFDKEENPILPNDTILNVNYPDPFSSSTSDSWAGAGAGGRSRCTSVDSYSYRFMFVLTRSTSALPLLTPADVERCGGTRLPTEEEIVERTDGCFVTVTVLDAGTKLDVGRERQEVVMNRLDGFLSCP